MLEDAAHLRVPLLVAAQVGRVVGERAHRAPDIGQRKAGQQLAVRHLFRRKGDRNGEDVGPHAGAPADDPEGRAAARRFELGLRDRKIAEQELRRRALHHPEVGQVGRRVADEEVVDVVLAGVHPGGERGPRRGRLRRVRGAERIRAPLMRELRDVRELALAHPAVEQMGIHPVEAQDDQFLRVRRRSAPAAARTSKQSCRESRGGGDRASRFPHGIRPIIAAEHRAAEYAEHAEHGPRNTGRGVRGTRGIWAAEYGPRNTRNAEYADTRIRAAEYADRAEYRPRNTRKTRNTIKRTEDEWSGTREPGLRAPARVVPSKYAGVRGGLWRATYRARAVGHVGHARVPVEDDCESGQRQPLRRRARGRGESRRGRGRPCRDRDWVAATPQRRADDADVDSPSARDVDDRRG